MADALLFGLLATIAVTVMIEVLVRVL